MTEGAEIDRKVKKASQILLLPRHQTPGVKGWELKRSLGKDYIKIIEILSGELHKLDLQVKIVFQDDAEKSNPTVEELEKARFFVISRNPHLSSDSGTSGWRIDDLAVLAASLAYVLSRQSKAPKKDVEGLLKEKFPRWKVDLTLERFIRKGYLTEGNDKMLYVGWRTRAEVDQKTLLNLILSTEATDS